MIGRSLRWRLLLGAAAAILLALGVAWIFMTLLFERHLERRLESELTRDALGLVATLSVSADGRPAVTGGLADPRLQTPGGGYYWQVSTATGTVRSRSLWDQQLPEPVNPGSGGWTMRRIEGPFGEPLALLSRQLQPRPGGPPAIVQLAQDTRPLQTARDEFGRELAAFLAVLWLVLSAAAWLQVALGLAPLARIRTELAALKESAHLRLPGAGLREIQPLADAINLLADARETDLERARRRAADLAHGLKTPLSALSAQSRRARDAGATEAADGIDRAIAAMVATVDAELARTRIAGALWGGTGPTLLRPCAERLVNVLEHTERGGELAFAIDIPADLELRLPAEAVSELLGAVLENAVRYARRQVRVLAETSDGVLALAVQDDGPGIASADIRDALARGGRLDESGQGTGLGLAIARELAEASGGSIALGTAALGGLEVRFCWPVGAA